jgi:hypothetical protein
MMLLNKRRAVVTAVLFLCAYSAAYPFARKTFTQDYSGGGKMIFLNTSFIIDATVFFGYWPVLQIEERVFGTRVIAMGNCRCCHPLGRFAF